MSNIPFSSSGSAFLCSGCVFAIVMQIVGQEVSHTHNAQWSSKKQQKIMLLQLCVLCVFIYV